MQCLCLFVLGCEDIVADSISLDSVVAILKWSAQPYGSKWVHRQAMHFLCEEFSQVMTSDVLYELSKEHLLAAIQSDYLQVMMTVHQFTLSSFQMSQCKIVPFMICQFMGADCVSNDQSL